MGRVALEAAERAKIRVSIRTPHMGRVITPPALAYGKWVVSIRTPHMGRVGNIWLY